MPPIPIHEDSEHESLSIDIRLASPRRSRASFSWAFDTYFIVTFPYHGKPHEKLKPTLSEAEPTEFENIQERYTEAISLDWQNTAQPQGGNNPGPPSFQIIAILNCDYGLNWMFLG